MQPYCNFCIAGVALKLNSVAVELHLLDGYLVYALTSAFILTESQWGQKRYYALLHLNLFTLLILQNIFGTLPVFFKCAFKLAHTSTDYCRASFGGRALGGLLDILVLSRVE